MYLFNKGLLIILESYSVLVDCQNGWFGKKYPIVSTKTHLLLKKRLTFSQLGHFAPLGHAMNMFG